MNLSNLASGCRFFYSNPLRSFAPCALVIGSLLGASPASAQPFDFVNITDMPTGPGTGSRPSINDNGDVAFQSGSDIYVFDQSQGAFLNLMTLPGAPAAGRAPKLSINGDVVMINIASRNLWLYEAGSQSFTNISTLVGFPGNTQANGPGSTFDINDNGQISFHSGNNNTGDIYVYDHNDGTFTEATNQIGAPASGRENRINNLGQVAYGSVGIVGAPIFVFEIATQTTTNITSLPGGPGIGLGSLSFNDNGGVAIMLQAGNDPVIYDAVASSFLHLATLPGFPAGNGSSSGNDLSNDGDFTFWRTNIHHFDSDTQTFTQLTNVPGSTPSGGVSSTINTNGVVAFEAGFFGVEDIFLAIPPCPADLNGDGAVDTADLGILLGVFGTNNAGADINGDGIVDTADLGALLGSFLALCS